MMLLLSSSFIGLILATLIAPKVMVWYFTSPVAILDCHPVVDWSIKNFLLCQIWGAGIGVIIGLVLLYRTRQKSDKNTEKI
jgi:hypothetical protein